MSVGVIGYGTVGQATASLFRRAVIYDPPKGFTDPSPLRSCRVIFLCVPTPTTLGGRCDLSAVHEAVRQVAPLLSDSQVIAVRSTVPPGTVRQLQEEFPNTHFAANPEFLRAHRLEEDTHSPWRVVIGADSVYTRQTLFQTYYGRLKRRVPYLVTDSVTAEFIKYAANCFLATKITYAREIRRAARRIGVRYGDVVRGLGLDPRIGDGDEWWLEGLTDECLPKDLEAFVNLLREWQTERGLLETVLSLRDRDLTQQEAR